MSWARFNTQNLLASIWEGTRTYWAKIFELALVFQPDFLARNCSPIFRAAISGWPEFQPEKSGWPDGPLARGPGIFISPKARGLEIFQPDPTLI